MLQAVALQLAALPVLALQEAAASARATRPELQPALPMARLRALEEQEDGMVHHLPVAEDPPNAVAQHWAVVQHWALLVLQVAARPAVRLEAAQQAVLLEAAAD